MPSQLYHTSSSPIDHSKKTIVFLHGTFMSSTTWINQISSLSNKFPRTNLLMIDVMDMAKPPDDELHIPSAVFIGISRGSLIALRMALVHPSYVQGVVAMSYTSRSATPAVVALFEEFYNGWVSTPTPSDDLRNLGIMGWGDTLDRDSPRCKMIKQQWSERYNGAEKVGPIAESLNNRDDIVARLKEIEVPVLLIHGEKDVTWTLEEAKIEVRELPRAELKVVEGVGHVVIFIREADDVNGWIEEFFRKSDC